MFSLENFAQCCAWARQNITIAHHIPGRIRLKFNASQASLNGVDLPHLKKAFEAMDGIKSLKINLLARSMVIEYDKNRLPSDAIADFLNVAQTPAALQFEKDFLKHF